MSCSAALSSPIRSRVENEGQLLRLTGRCPIHADPPYLGNRSVWDEGENPQGMTFAAELRAVPEGGKVTVAEGRLSATDCNAVTLVVVAATSFNGFDKSPGREGQESLAICRKHGMAADTPYAILRQRHVADFGSLMDRVIVDLGTTAAARPPTDERLGAGVRPEDIPALAALYYEFGRYLLVRPSFLS